MAEPEIIQETVKSLVVQGLLMPIMKDWVKPKIQAVLEKHTNSKTKIDAELIEKRFDEYLTRRYLHFAVIDTLVFPNKQTLLSTIYQPLTVTDGNMYNKGVEIKIDGYPQEFIPNYCRVIIEDTAGMGKSTISKRLFQAIVEQNAGIPILIELRHLNAKNRILKEIQKQLSPNGKTISQDVILKMIDEKGFIFLFDGFDEIANRDRDFVIKELHSFIEKAHENYFLITSRADNSLTSFGSFHKFRIKDLEVEEAYKLLHRYDVYSAKKIAKLLIEQLEDKLTESLEEYLTNPLLVSLLYKSFEYKKDIPIKKSQFYSQVYDALFEMHDLSKEGYLKRDKASNLHRDDFERVLRIMAYFTATENEVEYSRDSIISIIDRAKSHLPNLRFQSSDFLNDLLHVVPLFRQEGNYYRWSHKSLQDYFAAKFIWQDAKENRDKILRKIFDLEENERFYNLLDIYYELDPNGFDTTITRWLLTDFCKYANDNINKLDHIPLRLRKERICHTYAHTYEIVITKKSDYKLMKEDPSVFIREHYMSQKNRGFDYCDWYKFDEFQLATILFYKLRKNIMTIMRLLYDKKNDLILLSFDTDLDEAIVEEFFEEGAVYPVNMDADNIVNDPQLFELVNEMIGNIFITELSYDEAFKELERIEQMTKADNDFINW